DGLSPPRVPSDGPGRRSSRMSPSLLLLGVAFAGGVSERPAEVASEVVVARAEQTFPLGLAADPVDDDWKISVDLRLVTEARAGVTVRGTSRLTWDDAGFRHQLVAPETEARLDVVARFALDVVIVDGSGVAVTRATLA